MIKQEFTTETAARAYLLKKGFKEIETSKKYSNEDEKARIIRKERFKYQVQIKQA